MNAHARARIERLLADDPQAAAAVRRTVDQAVADVRALRAVDDEPDEHTAAILGIDLNTDRSGRRAGRSGRAR